MSNKKITDLNALTANQVASEDLFFITDLTSQETKKISAEDLVTYLGGAVYQSTDITASWALKSVSASYSPNNGVTKLTAGTNITLSPTNGIGEVTINSSGGGGDSYWDLNGVNIYSSVGGNVGIGTSYPLKKLDVNGEVSAIAYTSSISGLGFFGTSSWSNKSISSSYSLGSAFTNNNLALSSSYSLTASYVTGSIHNSNNPALSSSYSMMANNAISSSYSTSSSYAVTSSYALTANITTGVIQTSASLIANNLTVVAVPASTTTTSGTLIKTINFTPKYSNSIIRFRVNIPFYGSGGANGAAYLIFDNTVKCSVFDDPDNDYGNIPLEYYTGSWGTTSKTINLRAAGTTVNPIINGNSSSGICFLTIEELYGNIS